ncbi:MAG: 1-acyl-sn-glycerol-3-phosphate acyltransferase, partial [Clostridiales bacterium]|nr:1-acyl-sn-glycerol-3-phosphate acyltransferase [Clostridiales bacterium]
MRDFDFETLKHYKFYQFARSVARPVLRAGYRIRYKGLENIPKGGGYILAVNHTSALDPALVALPRQLPPLHFMAKEELFHNAFAAWLITHLFAFPVRGGKGDRASRNRGRKFLEAGHVLGRWPVG